MSQVAANPMVFAVGVGVANGVLAAVRNKPVSPRALYATAAVLAIGEAILIMDEPEASRPPLGSFMAQTAIGVGLGMAPFVSWQPGSKSSIQKAGEWLGDRATASGRA